MISSPPGDSRETSNVNEPVETPFGMSFSLEMVLMSVNFPGFMEFSNRAYPSVPPYWISVEIVPL